MAVSPPPGPYYFGNLFEFQPGTRHTAGSWGGVVQQLGGVHRHATQEEIFERVRRDVAPGAPSRLDAAYAFADIAFADEWLSRVRPFDLLYEVRLADPSAPAFLGDVALVDAARRLDTRVDTAELERIAHRYWQGCAAGCASAELVTLSPLEVVARIT